MSLPLVEARAGTRECVNEGEFEFRSQLRATPRVTDAIEERERAYEEALQEDLGLEWRLPMSFRAPDQTLRLDSEYMASIDKAIHSSNKGHQMLLKMGWKGGGLGPSGAGRLEPVRAGYDRYNPIGGVGMQEKDELYVSEENIERKTMEVEAQANETQEARERREAQVADVQAIKADVTEIISVFKCELCNKQYKTVLEYDQHLNSYDHHHTKRLREMKAASRESREDVLKRDQKRMEKEMAKINQLAAQQKAGEANTKTVSSASEGGTAAGGAIDIGTERQAVKIGFGSMKAKSKGKMGLGGAKKAKIMQTMAAFANDDEDED